MGCRVALRRKCIEAKQSTELQDSQQLLLATSQQKHSSTRQGCPQQSSELTACRLPTTSHIGAVGLCGRGSLGHHCSLWDHMHTLRSREGLALLLQIKRMTWICGLSSLAASFKLLILKQDKQRINNLVEHRESGSPQGKGSREASAASPHPSHSWVRALPQPWCPACPSPMICVPLGPPYTLHAQDTPYRTEQH